MQATSDAFCLICTKRTLKKCISTLTSTSQHASINYFILLLDEPSNIHYQKNIPSLIKILHPREIGLQETEWKMIVFENNCSKACLAIMPYIVNHLRKKNYRNITYIDFRIIAKKSFFYLIECIASNKPFINDRLNLLRSRLVRDTVIMHNDNVLMIYKNTWKDDDYFYQFYADNTAISQSDRIKYFNMHTLEKRRLDDPFNKKQKIRNIKHVIGQKKINKKLFFSFHISGDGAVLAKKYKLGIDNLISQLNTSAFVSLSSYVLYKIIMKTIINSYLFLLGRKSKSNNLGAKYNG